MRATMFTAIGAILWTLTLQADETLPVLEVKGQVYSNATVFKVTDTDIYFSSRQGLGNAKLKDLAPEWQKHFRYDSAKADAMEQKQAAATAQYHSQIINQPSDSVTELSWGVDLPAALNRARSENKIVLLDFTGSDWCPWCIKFDQEVLSTGKFANYAGRKLELVEVDFPNTKAQSDLLKHDNAELKQRFNVSGFPTYVLLNSDGKELGRQVGYRGVGKFQQTINYLHEDTTFTVYLPGADLVKQKSSLVNCHRISRFSQFIKIQDTKITANDCEIGCHGNWC